MKIHSLLNCLLVAIVAFILSVPSYSAYSGENDNDFIVEYSGTMQPYNFNLTDSVVPWNGDMTPVFINYVARHGARFLSSEKKIGHLRDILCEARSEGTLSEKGAGFLKLIERVESVTDGRWGALNALGMEEERMLATEMMRTAPGLLGKGRVKAIATFVPRVVMTMYEFCHQLSVLSSDLEISTSEGHQFDSLLRYFKTDSSYINFLKNPDWKREYDHYAALNIPTSPAACMFTIGKDDGELRKLTYEAYGILQSLPAAGIKAEIGEWFTPSDYRACWEADNLEHYYARSASRFSDIPVKCAQPLLESLIASADAAASWRNEEVAFLRFGHAETILPLFSLMRLPGCYAPDAAPGQLASHWIDSDISPLGANLMMVVLKDRKGETYVSLRLNGKWIEIQDSKVVEWGKLKNMWQSYMKQS